MIQLNVTESTSINVAILTLENEKLVGEVHRFVAGFYPKGLVLRRFLNKMHNFLKNQDPIREQIRKHICLKWGISNRI